MSRTLSLSTKAFSPNVFLPVKLSGVERINELFCYQLIVKTPNLDTVDFYKQFGFFSPGENVDITSLLGQNLTVGIEIDGKDVTFSQVNNTFRQYFTETVGQGTRYISGIITSARYLYNNERSSYYCIELRPFLYNATLKSDYKIFQHKNVIEILDEVLSAYSGTVEKRLYQEQRDRYPSRIYQNQHGETDYQFFCRLCSEWGINFYWNHTDNNHTLILSDEPYDHHPIQNEAYQKIAYYPLNHNNQTHVKEEHLHEFNLTAQMVSSGYISADYDYARASEETLAQIHNIQPYPEAEKNGIATRQDDKEKDKYPEIAQYKDEIYEYAADLAQPQVEPRGCYIEEHRLRNLWNLERIQQRHFTAKASGHIRGITTGYSFELEKHPNKLANIHWTVLGTELLIMDVAEETQRKESGLPSLLTVAGGDSKGSGSGLSKAFYTAIQNKLDKLTDTTAQGWRVECSAELIPANTPIRPPKIDKPKASLQNALVVGEAEGGALYLDAYGRIKVQFYWDRYGTRNENSSCWVRVNEPWAGNQMGAVFTPRIGSEVLIDFVNNDPDLPVCIGKVNNSNNMPNWVLAQNKALSGFRSREMPQGNSRSGRSNHLVFDDTSGNIQTQLKSDHAHSQLSLGDITRIEDNAGRKDPRGQGFELRTDDWGATRAAKGLYLTTYARDKAESTHMDAFEAQQLLDEAQQLMKQLSKLANQHQAEPLSGTEPLGIFSKLTQSELPDSINSVLSDSLPDKVKAQVSENILKNLAKQEAIPPLEPIGPSSNPLANSGNIGDLISQYARDQELYRDDLKAFANNPYDKARQKLAELEKISDPQEKAKALLKDQEIADLFKGLQKTEGSGSQSSQGTIPYSPKGFAENILVGAGEAGIALVTAKDTHQYSAQKHTITAGQDLNITTGNSWLASIQNKLSIFVQQGTKIFSGKGKVQIQANSNNVEIIADKTLKIISANDKVEVIAKKEILITCRGAYIRLKDGNIEIHAPGKIEQKAAVHPLMGPTSLPKEMPRLPTSELNIKNQFALVDNFYGVRMPNQKYRITLEDGTVYQGKSNDKGETQIIESHIPQNAKVEILDNQTGRMFSFSELYLTVDNSDYHYRDDEILVASTENIGGGLPKNDSYCSTDKVKLRSVIMADYDFGLRLVESCPKDVKGNDWHYPVAKEFQQSISQTLETATDWVAMCMELDKLKQLEAERAGAERIKDQSDFIQDKYYDAIAEQIKICCHAILGSNKAGQFKTPVTFPGNPSEKEKWKQRSISLELAIDDPKDPDYYKKNPLTGGFARRTPDTILLSVNPSYIHEYAYLQAKLNQQTKKNIRDQLALIGIRADIIGFIYHEMRHYQHFFWATVYAKLRPEDFFGDTIKESGVKEGLTFAIKNSIPPHAIAYIDKHQGALEGVLNTKNCDGMNHIKLGLKRIFLANVYLNACGYNKILYKKHFPKYQDALREQTKQEFQYPGHGGEKINHKLFLEYQAGALKTGYHLTPFEDDAHATQGIILHYEEQAFDKLKEKLKVGEFAFFHNQIKSQKIRPLNLPKPTDHSVTYPKPEERNKPTNETDE